MYINIHAWNDKRGLMPKGWRSLTRYDLIHLSAVFGFEFNLKMRNSPFGEPKGFRDDEGIFHKSKYSLNYSEKFFNEWNFKYGNNNNSYILSNSSGKPGNYKYYSSDEERKSGYVLCVRENLNFESVPNSKMSNEANKSTRFNINSIDSKDINDRNPDIYLKVGLINQFLVVLVL